MGPQSDGSSRRRAVLLPRSAPRVRLFTVTDSAHTCCDTSAAVRLLGGRADCDLSVSSGDVSKVHAAIVNTGSTIIVVDLSSRQGTRVNGERVRVAALRRGDRLHLGSAEVLLDFETYTADGDAGVGTHDESIALCCPLELRGPAGTFRLSALPAVVGRKQSCEIMLDTPDVSLAHALLFAIEGKPAVYDLGSRSGTIVNGERTAHSWIAAGDELDIGGTLLRVGWSGPTDVSTRESPVAARAGAGGPAATDAGGLVAPSARLEAREESLASRMRILDERAAALDARQARLARRERRLAQREAELTKRLRASMREDRANQPTRETHSGLSSIEDDDADTDTEPNASAARGEAKSRADALPAPLVVAPLFGADQAQSTDHEADDPRRVT